MKIRLLAPHGNLPPGADWDCPWVGQARQLIEQGKALALERADLHLNPEPEGADEPAGGRAERPVPAKATGPKRPAKAAGPKRPAKATGPK